MTIKQLRTALKSPDANTRADAVRDFAKTDFGVDALPVLRLALADQYVSTVINAAQAIAKLGPDALESPDAETTLPIGHEHADLETQLMLAGSRVWAYSGYANCYSACLDALVKLQADPDGILEFVHNHVGLSSPDDLIASLTALKTLATPDAADLYQRAVNFWRPELNKSFTKKVQALSAKPKPKSKTR
jgi:hypothetical protein